MFRRVIISVIIGASLLTVGCFHKKKIENPIANIDSKQPDKALFDRALDAMKQHKYDVARLSLQTLINTYPDSEYVARAKLAIGDSWYAEGGTAAMAQAESEYKDFITFFPNMPEAAEAQMKIANIHYKQMEKADRDPTHAKRAEEEYRQLIMQFPDSPLVPEAKLHLLQVQEVLASREYEIAHFYFVRESYPAAIARFKSLTDTYPLYSGADDAFYELGNCYEKEVAIIRATRLPESAKSVLVKQFTDDAQASYERILTHYPLEDRAKDARKRLEEMKLPVPEATPEAVAQDKAEIAGRGKLGMRSKVMENFHKAPDLSQAARVGEPTLVDPKQASAPEIERAADVSLASAYATESRKVAVEQVKNGAIPAENAPAPHSDSGTVPAVQNDSASAPGGTAEAAAPQTSAAPGDAAAGDATSGNASSIPAAGNASATQPASPAASPNESSSKKKKKKHFGIF
jgi:outer membrane protein assembly factor BamD